MDPRDQRRAGLEHECLRFKTGREVVTEMTNNFPLADTKQLWTHFWDG